MLVYGEENAFDGIGISCPEILVLGDGGKSVMTSGKRGEKSQNRRKGGKTSTFGGCPFGGATQKSLPRGKEHIHLKRKIKALYPEWMEEGK